MEKVIIRVTFPANSKDMQRIKNIITNQWKENGIVVVPYYCEVYIAKDAEIETRPQGKWIFEKANEEHTEGYICSNCKRSFHTKVPYFSEYKFCPNCGAEMRHDKTAN